MRSRYHHEAVRLVEADVPLLRSLEVRGQAVAVAAREYRLQHGRAHSLALTGRVRPQPLKVKVHVGRAVRPHCVLGGAEPHVRIAEEVDDRRHRSRRFAIGYVPTRRNPERRA